MFSLKNSRHLLNQSDAKSKPIATWSHAFSRACLAPVTGICFEFSLVIALFTFVVIGHCNCFWFWFYDTQTETAPCRLCPKAIHSRINLQSAPPAYVESGLPHHGTQDSTANHHTVHKWPANRRPGKYWQKRLLLIPWEGTLHEILGIECVARFSNPICPISVKINDLPKPFTSVLAV